MAVPDITVLVGVTVLVGDTVSVGVTLAVPVILAVGVAVAVSAAGWDGLFDLHENSMTRTKTKTSKDTVFFIRPPFVF
jgi:hypothetical protein